ncbi:AAA domain-containing protein [bacterium]|nr:AAA domain-containing protein [bacterium]
MLVDAVERGYWLVLDNANTCSSAVLDRLNSLLETDGKLVISEQQDRAGRPRVIRPHPDFRIFLTMNPSRGELSRAMRNRSVEIYLDSGDNDLAAVQTLAYCTEAAVFHWRRLEAISLSQYDIRIQASVAAICIDHMSASQLSRMSSYQCGDQLQQELSYYNLLPTLLFDSIEDFYAQSARCIPWWNGSLKDQPLHTESNEALLQICTGFEVKAARLGWLLESNLSLCRLRRLLSDAEENSSNVQMAEMTVLQRSLADRRSPMIPPVGALLKAFLSAIDEALYDMLANFFRDDYWPASDLKAMLAFSKDILTLSEATRLKSGILPIYVQIGEELFSRTSSAYPASADTVQMSIAAFETHLKLDFGQSLSRLWSCWRPRCAADNFQLEALMKLENVMQVFDQYCQQIPFVRQMVEIQSRLLSTRDEILNDSCKAARLLEDLQSITSDIQRDDKFDSEWKTHCFAPQFEALCQYGDVQPCGIHERSSRYSYAQLLAGRSTKWLHSPLRSDNGPAGLARLASFSGWNNPVAKAVAWKDTFAQDALRTLNGCGSEHVRNLDNLTDEVSWLATCVSSSTICFGHSQIELLGQILLNLILELVSSHQDLLKPELRFPPSPSTKVLDSQGADIFDEDVASDHCFRRIWAGYLHPALSLLGSQDKGNRHNQIGGALVYFALASLQLWVPDKQSDPALGLSVDRDRHWQRKLELENQLQALHIFESTSSGQSTSLRIRHIEEEIALMGLEPPLPPVVRLDHSGLLLVHIEFLNILNAIVKKGPETVLLSNVQGPFLDEGIGRSDRSETTAILCQNIEQWYGGSLLARVSTRTLHCLLLNYCKPSNLVQK